MVRLLNSTLPTNIRKVRGLQKGMETSKRKKKRGGEKDMLGRHNASLKSTETRDKLLYLQAKSYVKMPDATSLHHCLMNKQLNFSGKDPAKGVFSIMHNYFKTLGKYLLFTKYPTRTNMPTAQQKKEHKKQYWSHTAQIREALLYIIIKSLGLCNKLTATFK